jgi:glycerophosphoryl diester phosphodiesterase
MHAVQTDPGTQIIGHRGAAGHAPENTAAAIQAGLREGATTIELDIQFSSDGSAVVYHDRTLERMAGVKGRIRDQTLRELSGYDIGFKFGGEFRGLRLLTLDEAARLVPDDVDLLLEVKNYDRVGAKHLRDMAGLLRRRGGLGRCVISSQNEKILAALGTGNGEIRRSLHLEGSSRDGVQRAEALGCYGVRISAEAADGALIESCHARRMKVFVNSVNDPSMMKEVLSRGVDGVATGYPGRLAALLGGHAARARSSRQRGGRRTAPRPRGGVTEDAKPEVEASSSSAPHVATESGEVEAPRATRGSPSATGAGRDSRQRRSRRATTSGRKRSSSHVRRDHAAAEPEKSPANTEQAATETGEQPDPATRKRRRRGHRGGRRHRARKLRKQQEAGSGGDTGNDA